MGHTKNINTLKQQNSSFSTFLNTSIANLRTRQKPVEAKFEAKIKCFYKNSNWTYAEFGEGEKEDFRQVNENNLNVLKPVIRSIATNLVKGLPAITGSSAASTAVDATIKAAATVLPEVAMVSIATVAVVELLDLLNYKTTANYSESYVSKHIGPGLMLHMYHLSDTVKDKNITGNIGIRESIIGYKVIYSADQEAVEGIKVALDTLLAEMKILAKDLISAENDVVAMRASARKKLRNHDKAGYKEDYELAKAMEEIHDDSDADMHQIITEILATKKKLNIS